MSSIKITETGLKAIADAGKQSGEIQPRLQLLLAIQDGAYYQTEELRQKLNIRGFDVSISQLLIDKAIAIGRPI